MASEPTYSEAYQSGIREEMNSNPKIFIMGTDLQERGGHFAQVKGIAQEFGGERVRDTPISEAAMIAAGVGAAMYGMRPVVDLNFMDFALGAMDEIINQAAHIRYMFNGSVPLIIRATSGIAQAGAHHNNSFESFFAHTPGLSVAVPGTPWDVKGLLKTALRADDPVIFMMHKKLTGMRGPIGGPEDLVPFGKARIAREGADATLVTYGYTLIPAMKAAETLAAEGKQVEILDLRTLFPMDMDAVIEAVKRTGRMVVVDEAPLFASITAEIAATASEAAFDSLKGPIVRVGAQRAPLSADPGMVEATIPSISDIEAALRKVLSY
ncbi:MAG: alpha-ketoacid dehydrogenase subunit beta [Actinomycetota bacterium]|nr:alpha-ketoacid dehydrogenase subunit beta [Actinomycetota bacterium]